MKKLLQQSAWVGITCLTLILTLSSFLVRRGGDSYTISINGKQVIQHYLFSKEPLPSLPLDPTIEDQITVYYSECGKIGTNRKLSVRNEKNQVLKEWSFANVTSEHLPMTVNSKDLAFQGNIGLYYTSNEVTNPRKLVTLVVNSASASRSR